MARLRWGCDDLGVVAIREHGPPARWPGLALADRCVQVLGSGDLETLHPFRERPAVIGLDQQMDVVVLDAEVNDPEVVPTRGDQRRLANGLIGTPPTQSADGIDRAKNDVNRVPRVQIRSLRMGEPARAPLGGRPAPRRLPPRSLNITSWFDAMPSA